MPLSIRKTKGIWRRNSSSCSSKSKRNWFAKVLITCDNTNIASAKIIEKIVEYYTTQLKQTENSSEDIGSMKLFCHNGGSPFFLVACLHLATNRRIHNIVVGKNVSLCNLSSRSESSPFRQLRFQKDTVFVGCFFSGCTNLFCVFPP